jgi:hypothetical protein
MRIFNNLFTFYCVALSPSFMMPVVSGLLIGSTEEDKKSLGVNESLRKLQQGNAKFAAPSDSNAVGPGLLRTVLGVLLASNGGDTCPRFQDDSSYITQAFLLLHLGYEPYFRSISRLAGGDGQSVPSPGLCTTSYLSHAEVKQRIADLPRLQYSGEVYRENALGLFRLGYPTFQWCSDSEAYDYCGVIIGLTAEDHELIRPLLDELFGDGVSPGSTFTSTGNRWGKADFVASAADFLKDKDTLSLDSDAAVWTTLQLHKTALGVDLPLATAEAFVQLQGAAFLLSIFPDESVDVIATTLGTTVAGINAGKALFANIYKGALIAGIGSGLIDISDIIQLEKAAYAILDSFLFAGGLSIPAVIKASLAAYFTGLTPNKFDMTNVDDLKLLVLESVRL